MSSRGGKKTGGRKHRLGGYDTALLFPVLFLLGIGIVMVYSASSALAVNKHGTDYFFVRRQAIFALAGIAALIAGRWFPYRYYRALAYPLLAGALGLLALVSFTPLGHSAGGSTRWLNLGGLTFQPVEFARVALVIYLAYSLDKKSERVGEFSVGFLPHVVVLGIITALILLQPDFGSVILFAALCWIMMFAGGVRLLHLVSPLLILVPAAFYVMTRAQYRLRRWSSFMDPWEHASDAGYQIVHSLMAFGTGGIWGTGIGQGYQKLFYLPEPHTDFIFSVIGEELGLLGVTGVVLLYGLVVWRGVGIAREARDGFGALVALGLCAAIGMQACVNMGVTLGLLPTKGLTLPFLSYGGTSLLMSMASVGILMNIGASR